MKTLFITGATRNTGFATARLFAKNGYNIALSSRNADDALEASRKLRDEFGVPAKGYALDLSDTENINDVFSQAEKDFGTIDAFVANSANLGLGFGTLNTNEDDFDSIVVPNIKGTFFCCQTAAKIMKKHGGGSIVTIGSIQGTGAIHGRCIYSMSKAAISALVKNMAFELGEYNIRANNIIAGAIHSSRWNSLSEEEIAKRRSRYPIGRESTEEEIANAVFYLCSDLSASITGTDLTIDSGISVCILPYSKEGEMI